MRPSSRWARASCTQAVAGTAISLETEYGVPTIAVHNSAFKRLTGKHGSYARYAVFTTGVYTGTGDKSDGPGAACVHRRR